MSRGRAAERRERILHTEYQSLFGQRPTSLTYVHADRASEIDVTTRTLDDPEAFPPSYHSWESHKVRWFACPSDLPRHSEATPA